MKKIKNKNKDFLLYNNISFDNDIDILNDYISNKYISSSESKEESNDNINSIIINKKDR